MNKELDNNMQEQLLIAIIQAQDLEGAQNALLKHDFVITRLPSTGGFWVAEMQHS